MKITTSAPIFVPESGKVTGQMSGYTNVGTDKDWLSATGDDFYGADGDDFYGADGDQFIPFDGFTTDDLTGFVTETGEVFYSADGEDFYNAKGEKVKGEGLKNLFKKIGGGIGKGFKKVGGFVKKQIQAIGKKIKERKARRAERKATKIAKFGDAKKGEKPKAGAESLTVLEEKKADGSTVTTAVQELKTGSPSLPDANKVVVDGKTFDATNIPKGATISVATDASGKTVVGAEIPSANVKAVVASDGKIDYYKTSDLSGDKSGTKEKSNTTKYLMWGGIAVVVGLGIYLLVRKK